jgi:hypothetical protein
MSIAALNVDGSPRGTPTGDARRLQEHGPRQTRDLQRTCLLVVATLWLLDAVLQLQPFMFTPGPDGFSGMLRGTATGNPTWIAHSITWNASVVDRQPILTNTIFAGIQFLIGFGIVWRRTCKAALGLSVVWSLAVWWFGEGLGAIFGGGATTFGGGPGGVLFYALLAVLLWPTDGADAPFVAARTVGESAAKAIWAVVWSVLAVFSIVGAGRSPRALRDLVADLVGGEPGWLVHLDGSTESFLLQHGAGCAIVLAVVCVVVAVGVYLPDRARKATLLLAILTFSVIWVTIQNFGGILAGGATDPNAAPLVILLALLYWPLTTARSVSNDEARSPSPSGSIVEA